jgi:hypothetical protein
MIATRGADQQRFRHRVPAARLAADEELAQRLCAGRAAGLAGRDRVDALAAEGREKEPDLSRLAGSLATFEGDEASPQFFAPNMR